MIPVADAYTSTPDEELPTYPLDVALCGTCGLVQLLELLDGKTLFGTGYSFYSSASPPLSAYHATYAEDVIRSHSVQSEQSIVEIGCNDGDMLRHFAERGCHVLGIDPAAGPVDAARARGLDVCEDEFSYALAQTLRDSQGPADIIVANHVLAHVADVYDVLRGIAHLLADDGIAFIEVQYLPDLLINNAFDLIYHEHRNFFSLSSILVALRSAGLSVIDATLTTRQGGSLRVTLTKSTRLLHPTSDVSRIWDAEWWLVNESAFSGFQGRIERVRDRLWGVIADLQRTDTLLAGYGAPAKATTLLNFCDIDDSILTHVVDSTPAKQGRYIPGTGVQILSEDEVDVQGTYLLLAWNYVREITRRYSHIQWVIPLPAPVML